VDVVKVGHKSTGTPSTGFGAAILFPLDDSTTADVPAGRIGVAWSNAVHSTRDAYMDFGLNDIGGPASAMRLFISSSGAGSLNVGGTGDPTAISQGVVSVSGGYVIGNVSPPIGRILQSAAGVLYNDSTAAWPTGAAAVGTRPIGNGTNWIATTPASAQSSPANPTGTASTTGVMMGLAGSITTSSATSGKVLFIISGTIFNATAIADGGKVQLYTGTGTAPINGAALTGTARGGLVQYIAATTSEKTPFSVNAIATGLAASTAYWIDVGLAAITGGTATITDVSISAYEL
jgi:hypothetical protein